MNTNLFEQYWNRTTPLGADWSSIDAVAWRWRE